MKRAAAPAKINLSLAVGPIREDGLHELTSVFQRIAIADRIALERTPPANADPSAPAGDPSVLVEGFAEDTLVRAALEAVLTETGADAGLRATIEKQIPIAAGLGGGSADAGIALQLADELLGARLGQERLTELAFELGADVPFFLTMGPQLVEGAGERLSALELPQDYWVVVALPRELDKPSTGEIYRRFDADAGHDGYDARRAAVLAATAACTRARELARLPNNDLAPHTGAGPAARQLAELGAFRADVSGAGPAVYGLFLHERQAHTAIGRLDGVARAWLTVPVW